MPELTWTLRVIALLLFFDAIIAVQTAVLSRKMMFKAIFIRTLLATVVSGVVGIIMAFMGFGLWALVVHHLVSRAVTLLYMSVDKELRFPCYFSWQRAKGIYSFSGKILLTSMITGFHDTLRTMVIGRKYSAQDLAYYDFVKAQEAVASDDTNWFQDFFRMESSKEAWAKDARDLENKYADTIGVEALRNREILSVEEAQRNLDAGNASGWMEAHEYTGSEQVLESYLDNIVLSTNF